MRIQDLLLYGAAVLGAVTALLWLLSLRLRDVSIVDIFWGCGFVIVAGLSFVVAAQYGRSFPLLSLFIILWFQAALVLVVSLPVLATMVAAPGPVGLVQGTGLAIFAVGLRFETVGDCKRCRAENERAQVPRATPRTAQPVSRAGRAHRALFGPPAAGQALVRAKPARLCSGAAKHALGERLVATTEMEPAPVAPRKPR